MYKLLLHRILLIATRKLWLQYAIINLVSRSPSIERVSSVCESTLTETPPVQQHRPLPTTTIRYELFPGAGVVQITLVGDHPASHPTSVPVSAGLSHEKFCCKVRSSPAVDQRMDLCCLASCTIASQRYGVCIVRRSLYIIIV